MKNSRLVDENQGPLVDNLPVDSIDDIETARFLADVIEIVYKKRPQLRSLLDEMRVQYQEAREWSKDIRNSQETA